MYRIARDIVGPHPQYALLGWVNEKSAHCVVGHSNEVELPIGNLDVDGGEFNILNTASEASDEDGKIEFQRLEVWRFLTPDVDSSIHVVEVTDVWCRDPVAERTIVDQYTPGPLYRTTDELVVALVDEVKRLEKALKRAPSRQAR